MGHGMKLIFQNENLIAVKEQVPMKSNEVRFGCCILACDMEAMVHFYRDTLGLKTEWDGSDFNEAYRKALCQVPAMLTLKATDEFSFGIQALNDWAEQLENGSLAAYDNPWHIVWSVHGTYLCMLGSNGGGFGLYDKVLQYYPEMTWLEDVKKQYDELSDIFQTLAYKDGGVCGGFDMTPEDVRDPEKMKPVCTLIRRAAEVTEQIEEMIQKNLYTTDA